MEEALYREFRGLDGGIVHWTRAIIWTLYMITSTGSRQRPVPRLSIPYTSSSDSSAMRGPDI
ncbi:hypothetical protein HDG35_007498 [Paraburkholderia sp. JPY681]|nr:hypothetical protein [Paraburkholderia atlantica]